MYSVLPLVDLVKEASCRRQELHTRDMVVVVGVDLRDVFMCKDVEGRLRQNCSGALLRLRERQTLSTETWIY